MTDSKPAEFPGWNPAVLNDYHLWTLRLLFDPVPLPINRTSAASDRAPAIKISHSVAMVALLRWQNWGMPQK
jgi:hypothetical protein